MSIGLHEVNAGTVADTLAYPRLVADVGGTNVRFALEMAPMRLAHIGVLAGDDYPSLEAAMRAYLASLPPEIAAAGVRHAAIGIANPVLGDQIRMTNRDWAFSIEAMRQSLGFDTFVVLNDFAALAHALPYLPADELEQVGGVPAWPMHRVRCSAPARGWASHRCCRRRKAATLPWPARAVMSPFRR